METKEIKENLEKLNKDLFVRKLSEILLCSLTQIETSHSFKIEAIM